MDEVITEPMDAWQVGTGDILTVDGEVIGPIDYISEDGDFLLFDVHDDDGDVTQYPFAPFDTVRIFVREGEVRNLIDEIVDSVFDDYDWNENDRIEEEMYGPNPR